MTQTVAPYSRNANRRLLAGVATLAIATALPQMASAQSFQGSASVEVGGATVNTAAGNTTVNVNAPVTVINWQPNDTTGTGEIAFQPSGTTALFRSINFADFTVLNRILPVDGAGNPVITRAVRFDGTVNSQFGIGVGAVTAGSLWFYTPGGIVLGSGSAFNVGSLVLSTSAIASSNVFVGDAGTINFTGTPNTASAINIQDGAQINALINGSSYVAMVAPRIEQNGTVQVDGSVAYVGAEVADITMDAGSGLFDISVSTGTGDANGVVHGELGTTSGPGSSGAGDPQRIYMLAMPKNSAITMLVNGSVGYTPAASATVQNGEVVLSAGYNITNGTPSFGEHAAPANANPANITIGATSQLPTTFSSRVRARASGNLLASPGSNGINPNALTFTGTALLWGDLSSVVEATALESVGVGGDLFVSSVRRGQGGNAGVRALGGLVSVGGDLTVDASSIGFSGADAGISLSNLNGANGRGGIAAVNVLNGDLRITGATRVSANGIGGYGVLTMGNGFGGTANVSLSGANATALFTGGLDVQADGFGIISYLASLGTTLAPPEAVNGGSGSGGSALLSISDVNQLTLPTLVLAANGIGDEGGSSLINGGIGGGNGGNGVGGFATLNLNNEALALPDLVVEASGIGGDGGDSLNPGDAAGNGGNGTGGTSVISLTGSASFAPLPGFLAGVAAIATGSGGSGGDVVTAGTLDSGSGGGGTGGSANISIADASQLNAGSILAFADGRSGSTGTGGTYFGGTASAVGGNADITIATSNIVGALSITASADAITSQTSRTSGATAGSASLRVFNGTVTADDINITADALIAVESNQSVGSLNGVFTGDGTGGNAVLSVEGGTLTANEATISATGKGSGQNPDGSANINENIAIAQNLAGGVGTGGNASFDISGGTASFAATLLVDASGRGGDGYIVIDTAPTPPAASGAGGAGAGGTASLSITGGTLTAPSTELRSNGQGGIGGDFWGLNAGDAGAGGNGTGGISSFSATQDVFFIDDLLLSSIGTGARGGVSADPSIDGTLLGYNDGAAAGGNGGDGRGGSATMLLDFDPVLASLVIDTSGIGGSGSLGLTGGAGGNGFGGIGLSGARLTLNFGDLTVDSLIIRSAGNGGNGGNGTGGVGGDGGDGTGGDAAARIDGIGANLISTDMVVSASGVGGAGGSSAGGVTGSAGGAGQGGNASLIVANGATANLIDIVVAADATGGTGGVGGTGTTGAQGTTGGTGAVGINGATPGANGGPGGTGGDGGTGATGSIGGEGGAAGLANGGNASILVSVADYVSNSTFISANALGGTGGVGGTGGDGGRGGTGGIGGAGGTGANGLDNFTGGAGGAGGDGGQGGTGGNGGTGGFGGEGGNGAQGGFGLGGIASFTSEGGTADAGSLLIQTDGIGGAGGNGGNPGVGGRGGDPGAGGAGGSGGAGGFGLSAIGPAGASGPDGGFGAVGGNGSDGFFFGSSAAGFVGSGGISSLIVRPDFFGTSGSFNASDARFSSSGFSDTLAPDGFAGRIEIINFNGDPLGGNIQLATLDASALGQSTGAVGQGIFLDMNEADILVTDFAQLTTDERIVISGIGQGQFIAGGLLSGSAGTDILITHVAQPGLVDTVRGNTVSLFASQNFDAQTGSIIRGGTTVDIVADFGFANVDQLFATNGATIRAALDASLRSASISNGSLNMRAGFRTGGSFAFYQLATANVTGAVTASDAVNIFSGGDVVVSGGANITSGNAVTLNSGDDIIIRNSTITSAQNVTASGDIQLNVGAIAPIDAIPGEIRSLVVSNSTLSSPGFGLVLAADAIDATTGVFNGQSLTATVNNAPPVGVAGGNDGGLLSANCVQGNICLGAVTATTQIQVGPASGTVGLANRVTMAGSLGSNNISIRARDGVTFAGPLNATATANLLVSVLNGPIDLTAAANLSGGTSLNLYAGAGAITGPGATLSSGGNIGLFANGGISVGSIDAGGVLNTIANDGSVTTAGRFVTPGSVTVGGLLAVRGGAANIDSGSAITTGSILTTTGNDVLLTSVGGQSLGNVVAGRDLVVSAASLAATSVNAQRNISATVGGSITLGNSSAGNDILLTSGGVQTLGATNAGRDVLVNAASLDAASVTTSRNLAATVTGNAVLGNSSAASITLRAGQDATFNSTATAATAIDVAANGQAAFNGAVGAPNINVRSGNILIGAGGRLGTIGTTQNVVLTNSAGAQMTIGGSGVTAGYSLSDAEIARIFGNNIDISWSSNLATTGAPVPPPAGGFAQPSIVVGPFSLASRAGNATGNIAANGSLSIRTTGSMQVNGAVALNGAGANNTVLLSADQSLQILSGQGSVAIRDSANALAGTLSLNSNSIVAASTSALAEIAALTGSAAINTRLGQNDGFVSDTGTLSAGIVNLNGGNQIFVQNSGATTLFRDRRGISANAINVNLTSPSGLVIINGQITSATGFTTGLSAIPLLSINGVPSQTATGFDPLSTMNGCQITGIAACRQQENPVSVTEDDLTQPLDPDQTGDNQFPTALIELKDPETFGYPPLIDEPVTGSGNDDLWPATCTAEDESCPAPANR